MPSVGYCSKIVRFKVKTFFHLPYFFLLEGTPYCMISNCDNMVCTVHINHIIYCIVTWTRTSHPSLFSASLPHTPHTHMPIKHMCQTCDSFSNRVTVIINLHSDRQVG